MREVHDIVLRRESGIERFERMFHDARQAFEARILEFRSGPLDPPHSQRLRALDGPDEMPRWAVGWSIHVAPLTRAMVDFESLSEFSGGVKRPEFPGGWLV
ncbi:hypothetical protein JQC91_08885 [Jannaschia sp. Os4]|uniref:hypothetical protein n=1 Tax=Jannaschia sp. Os4 TaxID=2807617 RepID=UPI00193A2EA3|nr:hypothetical protein [Jannaschia sp. Os4]MBM2576421.1 hypothetical protein [Jannaschia sp. Os4]